MSAPAFGDWVWAGGFGWVQIVAQPGPILGMWEPFTYTVGRVVDGRAVAWFASVRPANVHPVTEEAIAFFEAQAKPRNIDTTICETLRAWLRSR